MSTNINRKRILVSAYACEPGKGSEIGVGWHWVQQMSRFFEVWVITRANNEMVISEWLKANPNEYLHFIYYDLPNWIVKLKKRVFGVHLYYSFWQRGIRSLVRHTIEKEQIEIFHHLTYGNMLLPLCKVPNNVRFIWGPAGGMETIDKEFSQNYDFRDRTIEYFRRVSVSAAAVNPCFRRKCKRADIILCKTESTRNAIPKKYQHKAILCTDVAVETSIEHHEGNYKISGNIKYISVGRLDAWRGFDLLIEAFVLAHQRRNEMELHILGKGNDRKRLERLITKCKAEEYIMLDGQVSMEEYYHRMESSDVVVNACLKEGGVTTAFDAMALRKPYICIETGGYTRYFDEDTAFLVRKDTREKTIIALSQALLQASDRKKLQEKSDAMDKLAILNGWDNKGEEINKLFL